MQEREKGIRVSHLNVRLSISLMLLKLLFVEVISGAVVIFFHSGLRWFDAQMWIERELQLFQLPIFVLLVLLKCVVVLYIILEWLNEYYEITPAVIVHRSGVIFRHEEKYLLSHIQMVDVTQTIFGRMLNYGTLSVYDLRRNKYADMYMIHNPVRYAQIIEGLLPAADERKQYIRGGLVEKAFNGYAKND